MSKIVDPEFARRLEVACGDNPYCPTGLQRGKQKWLREELAQLGDEFSVSAEAVSKWFAGETRPRPKMMRALANVLKADEAWLSLGLVPDMTLKEKKERSISVEGGALLLAGLIQISGGNSTFPKTGDASREDLLAIIDGEAIEIDAPLARTIKAGIQLFTIKREHEQRKVVGVIPAGFGARLFLINSHTIKSYGVWRGDFIELEAEDRNAKLIIGTESLLEITSLEMLGGDA